MRVVFFSTLTNSSWGGSEVLWYKSALHMRENGIQVTAFVKKFDTEPLQIKNLKQSGVKVKFYSDGHEIFFYQRLIKKIINLFSTHIGPFDELIKCNPDHIFFSQSHSYDLGYYSEESLQKLINSKLTFSVVCQNNTEYSYVPEIKVITKIKQVYENASRVFFVSKRNKCTAEQIICSKIENAEIISNSLSISKLEIGVLPYPDDTVIQFACVARLRCSHKGQNLLLDVLSQSKWKKRSWVLNLYGEGEDKQFLIDLAKFLNLGDRVRFHGHVDEIKQVWEKNHIFLLPSFGEGMPIALQEAMLCGRTCVVTDVGGNSELVDKNINGWIAKGTTKNAFDEAMNEAWTDIKKWRNMGILAFEKAKLSIELNPENKLYDYITTNLLSEQAQF
jgi:glycosyltransferase involved in cell wall biosynthesis